MELAQKLSTGVGGEGAKGNPGVGEAAAPDVLAGRLKNEK
jgi:hypothetical protein